MDGIIVINKQQKCTSHDVVYKVKKITGEKVGHTGTLDPDATGVLPLLIGKGTLLSKYLINHDKKYQVVLKLGEKTDTADSEGIIIETKEVDDSILETEYIESIYKTFIGKQKQLPPIYSAIKIKGKKLYEYARKGEKVEIPPREIEIYNIKNLQINKDNLELFFEVSCSKGTYIRSLCEDIASKLNTVGYMKKLNRIQVGNFKIGDAITVDELEKNINNKPFISNHLITIEDLFNDKLSINMKSNDLRRFYNGVKLKYDLDDGIYKIYDESNTFIGTGSISNKILKRDIVLKIIENN